MIHAKHRFYGLLFLLCALFSVSITAQNSDIADTIEDALEEDGGGCEAVVVIPVAEDKLGQAADSILSYLSVPEDRNEIIAFLDSMFIRTNVNACDRPVPCLFTENYRDPSGNRYFGLALKDSRDSLYMPDTTRVGFFRLQRQTPNPIMGYLHNGGPENQYFLLEEHAACFHLYAVSVLCSFSNTQSEGSIIIVEKAILKENDFITGSN